MEVTTPTLDGRLETQSPPSSPEELPSPHYILPRTSEESLRLGTQHFCIVQAAGGCLYHPSLGNLSRFKRVLDCATGTAAWAVDVVKELGEKGGQGTETEVDLCDVSVVQVPRHLPKGIRDVFAYDVLTPFPAERTERYDLIHQRMLVGAIRAVDWPQVLLNLKGGLEPGGYLLLNELGMDITTPTSAPYLERYTDILKKAFQARGLHPHLNQDLPDLMRRAGFLNVRIMTYHWHVGPTGSHLGAAYVRATLENAERLCSDRGPIAGVVRIAEEEGVPIEGVPGYEEVLRVMEGVRKEYKEIGGYREAIMVVGQKPGGQKPRATWKGDLLAW